MMSTGIHFRKMNGLGNDFVVLDLRTHALDLGEAATRAIADRKTGIGCDQLITIEPPRKDGDAFMGIRNADGSLVGACGNATRCVGRLLMDETGRREIHLETPSGPVICFDAGGGRITVDMGAPRLAWNEIPLSEEFRDTRAIELEVGPLGAPVMHSPAVVNMGNPHAVFFVKDAGVIDLARIGPMLEHHPLFPERANISVAQVLDRDHILLRVWERGAGLTRACGTAACATAVAAIRRRLTARKVTVSLPGGDLEIEWREDDANGPGHVFMTGPVEFEFEGELDGRLLAGAPA
jgi:diaminopimelate epimerase